MARCGLVIQIAMMSSSRHYAFVVGILVLASADAKVRAADALQFNRDVRPLLSDKCLACHGPDPASRKGELRLDVESTAKADRGGYAAIVAGEPDQSELVRRIASSDDNERMPPAGHGKPLSSEE